jgi:hypothetical protein
MLKLLKVKVKIKFSFFVFFRPKLQLKLES